MDPIIHARREDIKAHLKSSQRLNQAVNQILQNNCLLLEAATYFRVNIDDLLYKLKNIKEKEQFDKDKLKYETAVHKYLDKPAETSKKSGVHAIADFFEISPSSLLVQIKKARAVGLERYSYDRKVNVHDIFTYMEEKSFLDQLIIWDRLETIKKRDICVCQICALEQLSTLTCEYHRNNGKLISNYWFIIKQAPIQWLKKFEMRHSNLIYLNFDSYEYCKYDVPRNVL